MSVYTDREVQMASSSGKRGNVSADVTSAVRFARDPINRLAPVLGVVVGLLSLLLPAKYSTKAVVFPQLPATPIGNLSGIAAQFGLANFAGTLTLSFYDDVISSPTVLDSLRPLGS